MFSIQSIKDYILFPWAKPLQRDDNQRIKSNLDNINRLINRIVRLPQVIGLVTGLFCAGIILIGIPIGFIATPIAPVLGAAALVILICLVVQILKISDTLKLERKAS